MDAIVQDNWITAEMFLGTRGLPAGVGHSGGKPNRTERGESMAQAQPNFKGDPLERCIEAWVEAPPTEPHCSNCTHAKVTGTPDDPLVWCTTGRWKQGTICPLTRLIRHSRPYGGHAARHCLDYDPAG